MGFSSELTFVLGVLILVGGGLAVAWRWWVQAKHWR
jgi:hypothetical protein